MKNKQEIPAVIVADAKVFDYLKEKSANERHGRKPIVTCWTNRWQVLFPFLRNRTTTFSLASVM